MQQKISNQKRGFTQAHFLRLYKQTLQAEYGFKSGTGDEKTLLHSLTQQFLDATTV
jgi:hypothetical protein